MPSLHCRILADYYCPLYQTEGNNSAVTMELCDQVLAPTMFDSVMDDAKALGGSSMLTEWGKGGLKIHVI